MDACIIAVNFAKQGGSISAVYGMTENAFALYPGTVALFVSELDG